MAQSQATPQQAAQARETPVATRQNPQPLMGTWETVVYQYNGVTYTLLVPEANLAGGVPEGANVIDGGTITDDPKAVARAIEAGERGQQGQSFVGALWQAPPEIQGVFRSSEDVYQIGQARPIAPIEVKTPDEWAAEDAAMVPETTEPPINEAGETQSDVTNRQGSESAEFNQLMQNVSQAMRDPNAPTRDVYMGPDDAGSIILSGIPGFSDQKRTITDTSRYTIPPLTTEELRQTDAPKAALLESQGIFSVPGTSMVVQDSEGNLYIRPASETPPEGFTIVTYGGSSPRTPENEVGNPLEWGGQLLSLFGIPQNVSIEAASSVIDMATESPESRQILAAFMESSGIPVFDYGYPAFTAWQAENPEAADAARNGGYNGFYGERAVWERFQADRNPAQRFWDTILTDPTILSATGAGGVVRGAARNVENIPGVGRVAAPVLDEVGRFFEVPEQLLNEVADVGVAGLRSAGRTIGNIALPGGRNVSDAFRPRDNTVFGNAVEAVETALQDVKGMRSLESVNLIPEPGINVQSYDFGDGWTARRGAGRDWELIDPAGNPVFDGRWDEVVSARAARGAAPVLDEETVPGATSPPTATTRPTATAAPGQQALPIDQITEQAPATAAASTPPDLVPPRVPQGVIVREGSLPGTWTAFDPDNGLPLSHLQNVSRDYIEKWYAQPQVGRPLQQAAEQAPMTEPLPASQDVVLRADTEFQATPEGQTTNDIINSWNEQLSFIRPQTVLQRSAGDGRVGRDFTMRPIDMARALAPEFPERWMPFLRDIDKALNRNFIPKESERLGERVWTHFRGADGVVREDGRALKRVYEILLEADHVVREQMPIFNKHFGKAVELPEYAWKRWNYGGEEHTALDTLARTGGKYQDGTDLAEATELAIFHPNENVRLDARSDLLNRLSGHDETGRIVGGPGGRNRVHPRLISFKDERGNTVSMESRRLRDIFSTATGKKNLSVYQLSDEYQVLRDIENRRMRKNPDRMTVDDVSQLSGIANAPEQAVVPEPVAPQPEIPGAPVPPETPTPPARTMEEGEEQFLRDLDPEGAAQFERDLAASRPGRLIGNVETPPETVLPVSEPVAVTPEPVRQRLGAGLIGWDGLRASDEAIPGIPQGQQPAPFPLMDVGGVEPGRIRRIENRITDLVDARAVRRSATRAERVAGTYEAQLAARQQGRQRLTDQELQSFYVRGRTPDRVQMETLGQRFSDNGETILERWDRYVTEELGVPGERFLPDIEDRAAVRTLKDFAVDILPAEARTRYDAEFRKALKKTVDDGKGGTKKMSELEAQIEALEAVGRRTSPNKFLRGYDRIVSGLRKTFLYNWLTGLRYIATQLVGNAVTSVITGNGNILGDTLSGPAMRAAWRTAHNNGELPESLMDEALAGWGGSGQRAQTRGTAAIRDQTLEQAADQAKKGNSLLGKWTVPIADRRIRDWAGAMDTISREALYARWMDRNLNVARGNLRERMLASRQGIDEQEFIELFDSLPSRFSSSDIRETFSQYNQRWADRHARDWQEAFSKTDRAARDEVKRVFFTGDERNADVALKRILFFHYWMSRATPLYTEAIARNPYFLYQFSNMLEEMHNDDDLSGSRFMRMMESPFGFNLLIRPDAMFATFASLMEDSGYTPDGETNLGAVLRNSPIMINPLIQAGLNIVGAMGDTFGPDPVGANKYFQFADATIQSMNATFGWNLPMTNNIQDGMWRHVRDFVSGFVDPVVPDWMADHVEYSSEMAYVENERRSLVAEIALERGMSLDDPVVQQAMIDPESELYQEAMRRQGYQDLMDIVMRILPVTAVLYPKSQLASPKERTAAINREKDQAGILGMGTTPRGEQLFTERDTIAAATDYSRQMQMWEDEYQAIGTAEERGAYSLYNNIRFGSLQGPLTFGGQTYSAEQINALDQTQREAIADQWAQEAGVAELVTSIHAQKEAYREAHPEFAEFVTWRAQMNDYPGGITQWWADVAAGNPNAARWYNNLDDEDKQNEVILTSLEAYMAFQGEQMAYYDPIPTATNVAVPPTPYNPIGDESSSDGSSLSTTTSQNQGPTQESIQKQLKEYEVAVAQYDAQVTQYFGRPVNTANLDPMQAQAVEFYLGQAGIQKPRMGQHLYDYMEWAQAQQGGDASVSTYLAWYAQMYPQATEPVIPAA